MPFINREQIASNVRAQAEKEYRQKLRDALANPSLSAEQRENIRDRLQRVGQSRVYDAASPPPPGAIQLPRPSESTLSFEVLMSKKRKELVEMARDAGLPISGTKTMLAERLVQA